MIEYLCKSCGKAFFRRTTLDTRCYKCQVARASNKEQKPRKPISQKGKQTRMYETFRDKVAIPYLDKKYGRICAACKGARCNNENLDVEHKKTRGAHPELKFDVKNLQYMGRFPCHYEKTNGIKPSNKG